MNQDADRITAKLATIQKNIDEKLASGKLTKAKLAKLSKTLDVDLADHGSYRALQSEAVAEDRLSLTEAKMIEGWLGTTPAQFNKQQVAIKAIVTKIIGELLEKIHDDGSPIFA